jgi:hypothetical protein
MLIRKNAVIEVSDIAPHANKRPKRFKTCKTNKVARPTAGLALADKGRLLRR